MVEYSRNCKFCGEQIIVKQMSNGSWKALNFGLGEHSRTCAVLSKQSRIQFVVEERRNITNDLLNVHEFPDEISATEFVLEQRANQKANGTKPKFLHVFSSPQQVIVQK